MVGISFHVGSDCSDPSVYAKAIEAARKLFDFAETIGYHFKLLDIGGGFPGLNYTGIDEVRKIKKLVAFQLIHVKYLLVHVPSLRQS